MPLLSELWRVCGIRASLLTISSISLASISRVYTLHISKWRWITVHKPLKETEAGGSCTFYHHHLYCPPSCSPFSLPHCKAPIVCVCRKRWQWEPTTEQMHTLFRGLLIEIPAFTWPIFQSVLFCFVSFSWIRRVTHDVSMCRSSAQISGTFMPIHWGRQYNI